MASPAPWRALPGARGFVVAWTESCAALCGAFSYLSGSEVRLAERRLCERNACARVRALARARVRARLRARRAKLGFVVYVQR